MKESVAFQYLGWAAWVLALIPLVLLVRFFVKKSRWSILKMVLVSLSGVATLSLWMHYAGSVAEAPSPWGGKLGETLSLMLEGWTGSRGVSFLISTGILFLWTAFSLMDAVISTARFFINKPYVREIVKVREVEPEKPKAQRGRPAAAGGKPERKPPATRPDPMPKPQGAPSSDDGVPGYLMPDISLLKDLGAQKRPVPKAEIERNISVIRETLADHGVQVGDILAVPGPTVTLYKVYPAKGGAKVSAIRGLSEDVSVALKADSFMSSTLRDCVGFEVANQTRSAVSVRELVGSEEFTLSGAELPVAIGRKVTGEVKVFDLAAAPHLLVAGATMQGKSVGLNVIVSSLLYAKRPSEMKFVFIDPKKTEFGSYSRLLGHYLAVMPDADSAEGEKARAIVKTPEDADRTLRSLCEEMSQRYSLLEKAGTPKLQEYTQKWKARKLSPKDGHRFLPYLVVIIDEYSQLVLGVGGPEAKAHARSIMTSIISLAQMGRACGIHLIIATQTPRREVVSGMIKANFPMSIAFKTKTGQDSMVILDQTGAEDLIGKGDMLLSFNASVERIQCGYISSAEIDALTRSIEAQKGYNKSFNTPYYLPEVADEAEGRGGGAADLSAIDERFEEAARLVVTSGKGSTSDIQRRLGMGYAKAGRVMDQLEAAGIVGPQSGSKPREVLVDSLEELDRIIAGLKK